MFKLVWVPVPSPHATPWGRYYGRMEKNYPKNLNHATDYSGFHLWIICCSSVRADLMLQRNISGSCNILKSLYMLEMSDSDRIIFQDPNPNIWYGHKIKKNVVFSTIDSFQSITGVKPYWSKLKITPSIIEFFRVFRRYA